MDEPRDGHIVKHLRSMWLWTFARTFTFVTLQKLWSVLSWLTERIAINGLWQSSKGQVRGDAQSLPWCSAPTRQLFRVPSRHQNRWVLECVCAKYEPDQELVDSGSQMKLRSIQPRAQALRVYTGCFQWTTQAVLAVIPQRPAVYRFQAAQAVGHGCARRVTLFPPDLDLSRSCASTQAPVGSPIATQRILADFGTDALCGNVPVLPSSHVWHAASSMAMRCPCHPTGFPCI